MLVGAADHAVAYGPRRVPPPGRVGIHDLALHQVRVHFQHHVIAHRHPVMGQRAGAQGAPDPELDAIGLEDPLLERVRPEDRERVEVRVVADLEERIFGPADAVVEHHLAKLHALEARNEVLERGPGEEVRDQGQAEEMPVPLMEPVVFVEHQRDLR